MYLPCVDIPLSPEQIAKFSALALAFIGDAVQTIYVRTRVALTLDSSLNSMHSAVSSQIKATSQSEAVEVILDELNELELSVYKRARNAKSNTSAKNSSIVEYRRATGYEALLGFLYLSGQKERLEYILMKGTNL